MSEPLQNRYKGVTGVTSGSEAAIAGLVVKGTVKVNIETVLPLPEACKAQALSKTGHSGGKNRA